MPFKLFATAKPMHERHLHTVTGITFETKEEALERAAHLHNYGWSIYRITGPEGFEMGERALKRHLDDQPS
jgi:hypothetical protein